MTKRKPPDKIADAGVYLDKQPCRSDKVVVSYSPITEQVIYREKGKK